MIWSGLLLQVLGRQANPNTNANIHMHQPYCPPTSNAQEMSWKSAIVPITVDFHPLHTRMTPAYLPVHLPLQLRLSHQLDFDV
jgi:hypothetical protein